MCRGVSVVLSVLGHTQKAIKAQLISCRTSHLTTALRDGMGIMYMCMR